MSTPTNTTFDVSWGNGYHQLCSSFSALFFAVYGCLSFFRLHEEGDNPTPFFSLARALGVLCIYKGLAAFWNHALNESVLVFRILDLSAQLWLVNQIFVWVVVVPCESCFYYYSPRVIAAAAAHVGGVVVVVVISTESSPSLVLLWGGIVVLGVQIGSIFVALFVHEKYNRRRWFAWGTLAALVVILLVVFMLHNETSIFLGQFGMAWFHITQVHVLLGWYIFWSQRFERSLICGCGESLNAIYCC